MMLSVSHRSSSSLPSIHRGVMDGSGTINPAALNAPGKLASSYVDCDQRVAPRLVSVAFRRLTVARTVDKTQY